MQLKENKQSSRTSQSGNLRVLRGWLVCVISAFVIQTAGAQAPLWTVEASNYQYNANITAIVLLDDIVNEDTSDMIGVFAGDEVRGVASPLFAGGAWRYFLTVYSNTARGESLTFALYVSHLETILPVKETVRFVADSLYGDFVNPMAFHASTLPVQESLLIQVQNGWNLVAVPLTMHSYAKTSLFPTATSEAFLYLNGYQPETTLGNGEGYWLKFSAEQTITLQGYTRMEDTIEVRSGWNLVGSISLPVSAGSVIPVGTTILTSFFCFSSGYHYEDTIQPGKSYWVKVSHDGQLVMISLSTFGSKNIRSYER